MKGDLIRQLEKLTNSQVQLTEGEIDLPMKKRFYGVSADFQKDLKRLIGFYQSQSSLHPELKSLLRRVQKLQSAFDTIFILTEAYLDQDKESLAEKTEEKQVEVGKLAQVYNKGEAFIGPLVAFGEVRGIIYNDSGFDISFEEYEPTLDPYETPKIKDEVKNRKYYSSSEYDIVRVDPKEQTFESIYKKTSLQEVKPSEPLPDLKGDKKDKESKQSPPQVQKANPEPQEITSKTNPIKFNRAAQQTKDYVDIIQKYVQPDMKDVAESRKRIYDEFLAILKRYEKSLPLDTSDTSIETLISLNDELNSFIDIYEIPTV